MQEVVLAFTAALLVANPSYALASSALTCRDSNELTSARSVDGFAMATLADAASNAFRAVDAERASNGLTTFMQDWNENRRVGEVIAVVVSCQKHPGDTIDQRSAAIYKQYVILHSQ